jgi:hypothetical protein
VIRVTIELLPYRGGPAQLLGVAMIANTGESKDPRRGNYTAVFATRTGKPWKTPTIQNYPRQAYQVWILLYRLLKEAVETTNKRNRA